jgi:hypothetical protein
MNGSAARHVSPRRHRFAHFVPLSLAVTRNGTEDYNDLKPQGTVFQKNGTLLIPTPEAGLIG